MSSTPEPQTGVRTDSRIDRLALRIAYRRPSPTVSPHANPAAPIEAGHLSRRTALKRAAAGLAFMILPLRLISPTAARADAYCAAACLTAANTSYETKDDRCAQLAYGATFPDGKAFSKYVAQKVSSKLGVGAAIVFLEMVDADKCYLANWIQYNYQAGKCGDANCGDPAKYPPPPSCNTPRSTAPSCSAGPGAGKPYPPGTAPAGCCPGSPGLICCGCAFNQNGICCVVPMDGSDPCACSAAC
jgi:hypothetical protein